MSEASIPERSLEERVELITAICRICALHWCYTGPAGEISWQASGILIPAILQGKQCWLTNSKILVRTIKKRDANLYNIIQPYLYGSVSRGNWIQEIHQIK